MEDFQESVLSPEQERLLARESELSAITLKENGEIQLGTQSQETEQVTSWKQKEGVIDVQEYDGALIIVYNAQEKIPDGCPDLRGKRSGEYDPETKICYVDLTDSWSFLEDKYIPSSLEQYVRHELRHHMVNTVDTEYDVQNASQENRYKYFDNLKAQDEEKAMQLAYLDELHSQYFDAVDGALEGRDYFTNLSAEFYTIHSKGSHSEVATSKIENREMVAKLFVGLQASLLLQWANKKSDKEDFANNGVRSIGVVLATERSLDTAAQKIEQLLQKMIGDPEVKQNLETFLQTYTPQTGYNMPVLNEEIKRALGAGA